MIIKFRTNTNDDTNFYKELEDLFAKETSRYYNIRGEHYLKDYT
mgnify:CR=1 FL=1